MFYFNFSKSERRGMIIFVLCIIPIALIGIRLFAPDKDEEVSSRTAKRDQPRYYAQPERKVETFPFDPNTADSSALLRLGLAQYMVRGIYKYRSNGGVYSEPEDFKRVPGMTNGMWERLAPYFSIDSRFRREDLSPRTYGERPASAPPAGRDTTRSFPRKLAQGETVSLNGSDTTELKRIPGIGSYRARRIVSYRERLGGFVSTEQVYEADDGVPSDAVYYLTLGETSLRKIDLNAATQRELLSHPYINSYQAQAIYDCRRTLGKLRSEDDLRRLSVFTDEDILRLAPYLEFK